MAERRADGVRAGFARRLKWRAIGRHESNVLNAARAVAAGLVVVFHAKNIALGTPGPLDWGDRALYAVADLGTPAVFWFFVLSGYLVGGSVIGDVIAGRFAFRRYAAARASRLLIVLLPALLLGALCDAVRVGCWGLDGHAGFETSESYRPLTLLGNAAFLETLLVPTFGSNYALWSLAAEFWFYVMFPLLLAPLMGSRIRAARAALFVSGLLAFAFVLLQNHSMAWQFVIWIFGAALRLLPPGRPIRSQALAWALAIAALFAFPFLHPRIGIAVTMLTALTVGGALLASARRQAIDPPGPLGPPEPLGRWAPVAAHFADFSFSLYLVHLPLQNLMGATLGRRADPFLYLPPRELAAPGVMVAMTLASYAIAYAFFQVTERHTGALRRRLDDVLQRRR